MLDEIYKNVFEILIAEKDAYNIIIMTYLTGCRLPLLMP